ncbi:MULTISPECIES: CmcJ/NvfI family oxidoreductase [Paraburkholderia]|uniref:CmcJ/NvfI family oxidoreductase n=1 Tax=Paraburkholderia TaxID=1822464 RepID=UPI002253C296|nr:MULTISPECIES: CmcJ/NvfI family oxidoreductase [Paraburkholderia]MCX4163089.1 CmcJ/NvfI family oxidoreductase [Paraburkholderia megapolitana]MDN7158585.1 methyltransferase [Paraburkholderia sp. CHISQ3]MDQ6495632.1 methyltransferase [Paraburkholderia megapolitana]
MAFLSYLVPTTTRPVSYAYEPPSGVPWESAEYERRPMPITDARSFAQPPSIHREGFELRAAPTAVKDFLDADVVKTVYYREAMELALAVTGASRAWVFDHLVRRREAGRAALTFGRRGADGLAAANGRIHNDYTEASGRARLQRVLYTQGVSGAAARVRRYSIVNIWRSIRGTVLDTPLAVCDARSVMAADLVESEVRYPQRTGEIYTALHSPMHRWCWFSQMTRDEALVFKQYDAQISGVARYTLHTAFDHPFTPADAPLRESIELRCLVAYDVEEEIR